MLSLFFNHIEPNTYGISIHNQNISKKEFYNYLKCYECDKTLRNKIILGEDTYTEGYLIIVDNGKEFINAKITRNKIKIKKRITSGSSYLEYAFSYNHEQEKYAFSIIENNKGIKRDVTNQFNKNDEVFKLISENEEIRYYTNINVITRDFAIINGSMGLCEISDEEISLYSSRTRDEDLDSLQYQRYLIVKNDTLEILGNVTFNFPQTNISYFIKDKYRGSHYAGKALKLMLELIRNNKNFMSENLYVRIYPNNLASIKTAQFCKLELVSDDHLCEYVVNPQKKLLTHH